MTLRTKQQRIMAGVGFLGALLWMVIIFSFSADTGEESGSLSLEVIKIICNFLSLFAGRDVFAGLSPTALDVFQLIVRKGAHMFIYMMLAGHLLLGFLSQEQMSRSRQIFLALTITFAYACSDELHQLFSAGRGGRFTDVLIDMSGALIGVLLVSLLYRLWRRRTQQVKV